MGNLLGCASERHELPEVDISARNLHEALKHGEAESTISNLLQSEELIHEKDQHGNTALHIAAKYNPLPKVCLLLLESGADLEAANYKGRTPLSLAAEYNAQKVVRVLLEKGADSTATDTEGNTILHASVRNSNTDVIAFLVEHGASVKAVNYEGQTSLHKAAWAAEEEAVELFLDQEAVLETRDKSGCTPLHLAAYSNSNPEVTTLLLEKGANIHAVNYAGQTPLHKAAAKNSKIVCNVLLQRGANLEARDNKGYTALHHAGESNTKSNVIHFLLDNGATIEDICHEGQAVMHKAAASNLKATLEVLVERGASLNATDSQGCTPLHLAAKSNPRPNALQFLIDKTQDIHATTYDGKTPLHLAAMQNYRELIGLLLESGAKLDAKDHNGFTPLHESAHSNPNCAIASFLLDKGADINTVNNSGETPLHKAVQTNSKEVVKLLLVKGANLKAKDYDGCMPLHCAASHNPNVDVINLLLSRGANIHATAKAAAKDTLLLERGADIDARDDHGQTPLHAAAHQNSQQEVISFLLKQGARIGATDKAGHSPLHKAAKANTNKVINALLQGGANIEAIDYEGGTPLHHAAMWNSADVVDFLLQQGANINATDYKGDTPLHYAASSMTAASTAIVQLLVKTSKASLQKKNKSGQLAIDIVKSQRGGNRVKKIEVFQKFMEDLDKSNKDQLETDIMDLERVIRENKLPDALELLKSGVLHKALDQKQLEICTMALNFLKHLEESLSKGLSYTWQAKTLPEIGCQVGQWAIIDQILQIDPQLLAGLLFLTDAKGQNLTHILAKSITCREEDLLKTAELLVDNKQQIKEDDDGITPIILAIENNLLLLLKHYLQLHPEMAKTGCPSPIWHCAVTGNAKAAELLIPHLTAKDVRARAPDTSTPYLIAKVKEDQDMVKLLEDKIPEEEKQAVSSKMSASKSSSSQQKEVTTSLQKKTRKIPLLNDKVCRGWDGGQVSLSKTPFNKAVKPFVLQVCGIGDSRSNDVHDLVYELEDCHGKHPNENSNKTCRVVSDMLRMASRLEKKLQDHSMFKHLDPIFVLIGSLAESTRLGPGNELDITVMFKSLKAEFFTLGKDSYEVALSPEGTTFFSRAELKHLLLNDKFFDAEAFMVNILDAFVSCMGEARPPNRLSPGMKNGKFARKPCEQCQEANREKFGSSQFPPQSHCQDCLPGVTMTKLGPCLLFQWRKEKGDIPIVCSIDMIPVIPHSATTEELFQQMVQTLIREKPEGWEKTMKNYLERDRMVTKAPQTGETSFALKIQHFGPKPNFMIRAGQSLDKELLQKSQLKDVYIDVKALKAYLKKSSPNSYFVKKVLLKQEVQEYIKKNPSELQLFYHAICQPELRPFFQNEIDYGKLRDCIRQRETNIPRDAFRIA